MRARFQGLADCETEKLRNSATYECTASIFESASSEIVTWCRDNLIWLFYPIQWNRQIKSHCAVTAQADFKMSDHAWPAAFHVPPIKFVSVALNSGHWYIIVIIINPSTARVVGAPQIILKPVFSIFPCSPLPSGTCRTPGLMLSSHLFLCLPCLLPPFTVPYKMVLARPDERETWPYHCSLRLCTIVRRSSCGPIACWIFARTSSLVTWSLYEMCSILR